MSRRFLILLLVIALLAIGGIVAWSVREPIARNFIDHALARRGIEARYKIVELGFRRQRLEDIVLGDPNSPDLVARSAEISFGLSGVSPSIRRISADGVRLRARIADGKLHLGVVDRLLPAPSNEPFHLPDIDLTLSDSRIRLATDAGSIGIALEGSGNLVDGFTGRMAAVARNLVTNACRVHLVVARVNLVIEDRRPALDGPLRAARVACGETVVERPAGTVDLALSEAFDRWNGGAMFATGRIASGPLGLASLRGRLGFSGNAMRSNAKLQLSVRDVTAGNWAAALQVASGTPVAPLAVALHRAAVDALAAADIDAEAHYDHGAVSVTPLRIHSRSGALFVMRGGGIGWSKAGGGLLLDGEWSLVGGGFPEIGARMRRGSNGLEGVIDVAPFADGGSRLQLDQVRFGEGRLTTRIQLDGPLGDGRVQGMAIAIDGRTARNGSMLLNPECSPLQFTSLATGGVRLGPTRLQLCPLGPALFARDASGRLSGGVRIANVALRGTSGASPLGIAIGQFQAMIAQPGFTVDRLAVRLGLPNDQTRLDIAQLGGALSPAGMVGRFNGAAGKIGPVPLLISGGEGSWELRNSVLGLKGGLILDDAQAEPRFHRLVSKDFTLDLRNGKILAGGSLHLPDNAAKVAQVRITHDLGKGTGLAMLDVPGIGFGAMLQPENLTRLALGVVANVSGSVEGQGRIYWDGQGVRSDGDFETKGLDLAAAFGPVTGLAGRIHFSDLLALETPPGQVVTLGSVNPGVAVQNGVIRYQLLRDQMMRIEGGGWPFSGGQLMLEPTLLDFGRPIARNLTFRVEEMDAALFVEQFDFRNIAVTGTFDGVLPMIFDAQGGRIERGRLVVRKGGGTLAYVGELSNEKLGRFAGMAFDALKSIKYDNLAIELDGALDGEIVSRVIFAGTNKAPLGKEKNGLMGQLTGLPFHFNIKITAPFRSLINSAQSINDPKGLVSDAIARQHAAEQAQDPPAKAPPVQTKESEKVR